MSKAIILARVSSKEQEVDGNSLEAQVSRLEEYVERKELELIHKPYKLVESSTQGDRRKFMKIMDDSIESVGNEVLVIVADKVDRFQRGFKETVWIYDKIKEGTVELHFASENLILHKESPASDIMRWNMTVIGAQYYCLTISENVKRTYELNLKQGEPIGKLPLGYLNIREDIGNGRERAWGQIDPERAYLVKESFEQYSTGTYSIRKLAKMLREKGLTNNTRNNVPVSKGVVERMLNNPIYYGMYEVKGKQYPHEWGNIITKELFDICQDVKSGKGGRKTGRNTKNNYIFSGFIRCNKCSGLYSPYTQKGNVYLMCSKPKDECPNVNVSEKILIEQLEELFKNLVIPKKYMHEIVEGVKNMTDSKNRFQEEQLEIIDKQLQENEKAESKLLDLFLAQSITKDVYDNKAKELRERNEELLYQRGMYFDASLDYGKFVSNLLTITSRAWEIFESSSPDKKRELLGLITLNLTVDDKKLDVTLAEPFDKIYELNKSQEWGALRDSFLNLKFDIRINLNSIQSLLQLNL
ncbi:MAG: recombinase family protein [Candidatus Dojkabacteria bacterium]|jgi:site-specific DNA recombinase